MPRERIIRRQKDLARLLRERKQVYGSKLKTFKKKRCAKKLMMTPIFAIILSAILLTGCATTGYHPSDIGRSTTPGIYHEVRSGQTMWEISKIYDVELEKIIRANRLPDASKLEVGQLIFIPEGSNKVNFVKSKKVESFIWPVKGVVVSYFGSMKNLAKNKGIDIQTREGADVLAACSGKVTFVSNHLKGYGKTIIIDHSHGFQTVYAHNAQNLVNIDQRVKSGEIIAKVGKTGRVDNPSLHFEIRKEHKPQNPFYYLP